MPILLLTFAFVIVQSAPTSYYDNSNGVVCRNSGESRNFSASEFFEDFENWMQTGCQQYSEFSANKPVTAEVVVGTGEEYEDIQAALDTGYSCVYLKKQQFNITKPITPQKEDFYIVGDGAEIVAIEPISTVLDIRAVRYAHLDGLFINGNGLARKCIDAFRSPSEVPVHQICNCKIWGATFANVDFTGCEDSLIFNCWIDGRRMNDAPDAIAEYGVKLGEFSDGYRTGGQVNLIHCLICFHRRADVFAKNIAQLKLANCLLASKTMWSSEFEAHIIVEGGTGENAILPVLEMTNCWVEDGRDGIAPNILVRNRMVSKLTIVGGMFYADQSPNIYSLLNPCAETITLVGAFFEHNWTFDGYNIAAPTCNLVSVGNTYNWHGIDKANITNYLIFDRDNENIETNMHSDQ